MQIYSSASGGLRPQTPTGTLSLDPSGGLLTPRPLACPVFYWVTPGNPTCVPYLASKQLFSLAAQNVTDLNFINFSHNIIAHFMKLIQCCHTATESVCIWPISNRACLQSAGNMHQLCAIDCDRFHCSSHRLLFKLGLPWHLATVINCTSRLWSKLVALGDALFLCFLLQWE